MMIYEDKDATVALGHNVKKASAETVKHVQDVSSPNKLTYFSQENYSSEPKPTPDTAQKNNTPLILMCAGLLLMSVIFGVSAFFLYNKNLPENRYEKSCERSQEFLENGDYEEAIEEARKALEIYPEKSQGYLLLAKAYYHKGDHEEAVDILSNVPERLKDNKKITELLTKILWKKKLFWQIKNPIQNRKPDKNKKSKQDPIKTWKINPKIKVRQPCNIYPRMYHNIRW